MPNKIANTNEELQFTDNVGKDKAILGVLEGPCADFMSATRNGRKYNESLWEKVFNSPIVTELLQNGGIPGELDHPSDRSETDSTKIAILLQEKPKKKNGELWAKFSILNTPCGQIAYTLCKAGFKFGISSRGEGDVYTDYDGSETVDEDTYDFKGFDLVLIPAVKAARLNLVTEGLDTNKFDYKKALKESLQRATVEDRKVMEQALSDLDIELDDEDAETDIIGNTEEEIESDSIHEYNFEDEESVEQFLNDFSTVLDTIELEQDDDSIKSVLTDCKDKLNSLLDDDTQTSTGEIPDDIETTDTDEEADDAGLELVEQLQDALKTKNTLEKQLVSLQEKLSVCYTKEAESKQLLDKQNKLIERLKDSNKDVPLLRQNVQTLQEQLSSVSSENNKKMMDVKQLQDSIDDKNKKIASLSESLNSKDSEITELNSKVQKLLGNNKKLRESYSSLQSSVTSEKDSLNESLAEARNDLVVKSKEFSQKLQSQQQLTEKYKRIAKNAVDRYISLQASKIGVSSNEIRSRLAENYTFSDIDKICEDLRDYKVNISKLPFNVGSLTNKKAKINFSEGYHDRLTPKNEDDEIDEQLLRIAQLD